MRRPPDHPGQLGNCFLLHRGAGAAAVERMVVGIDPQRELIGQPGDGMRGLEHLARVERMEVRVVVVESLGDFAEDPIESRVVCSNIRRG